MVDFSTVDMSLWIPVIVVAVLIYAVVAVLRLPEEYFKSRQLREAMMKRRAERADLDRMETMKAVNDFNMEELEDL